MNIIIADDQCLFREMLKEILELDSDLKVLATCGNGEEVLKELTRLYGDSTLELIPEAIPAVVPDVILLDINMPIKSGLDALSEIKLKYPKIKVCLLTTFEDDDKIRQALALGADGYIVKDLRPKALQLALKCMGEGMVVFQKGVFQQIAQKGMIGQRQMDRRYEVNGLTFDAVDMELMKHIANGCSNRDIATIMNYSEGTIKNRVSKLLSITGLSDRTEISVFAVKHQLI